MKYISFLLTSLFFNLLHGQTLVDGIGVDTSKLKSYITYLKLNDDQLTAAVESILLATACKNDKHTVDAIKLNASLDSFTKGFDLIPLLQDTLLKRKWTAAARFFSHKGEAVSGEDSIYLNFVRLVFNPSLGSASDYYFRNKEVFQNYGLSKRFHDFMNKSKKKRGLAAALSLFPGLGKLYAGRRVDALGSFFNTGMFTTTTFIFIHHLGNHPITYISAGLAFGFYVAGIVGTQTSITHDRNFKKTVINEEVYHSFKHYVSNL